MAKKMKAGFITIGQSPRPYIMKSISPVLEAAFEIMEDGALDGYTYEEISKNFPLNCDNDFFVTELSDGTEIRVNNYYIKPLIQESIERLEKKGTELIVLMCTGEMGSFHSNVFFAESSEIVRSVAAALGKNKQVGIFIPDEKQMKQMEKRWKNAGFSAEIYSLSPYMDVKEAEQTIVKFKDKNWDMALLDCMGYTEELKQVISEKLNTKVLLSRSVVASVIIELA